MRMRCSKRMNEYNKQVVKRGMRMRVQDKKERNYHVT